MHRHRLGGATDLDTALAGASSQALRAATIIRRTREMLARRDIEFVHEDLAGLLVEAKNLACMGAPALAKMTDLEIVPGLGPVLVSKIRTKTFVHTLIHSSIQPVSGAA